jgi:outer membrane autotransporter protein
MKKSLLLGSVLLGLGSTALMAQFNPGPGGRGGPPPPIITITNVIPNDPGDPSGPGGLPPVNPPQAPAPMADAKDMKDMKDMKQTVTVPVSPSDYFEIFLTGSGTYGDMGDSAAPGHYYFDQAQGNLGFAYHFEQDWTVGLVFSYAHLDAGFGNINASTTEDSYLPTLYLAYNHEGWFADISTTDGYDTYTEQRGTSTGTAMGASDGFQYGGQANGGYLFKSGDFRFGPEAGVSYTTQDASGFNEGGAGAADLHFNREYYDSLLSEVGGLVRYDTNIGNVVVSPYFSAEWQHEYLDDSVPFSGNIQSTGAGFSGRGVHIGRDSALLELGVSAAITQDVDVFLGYQGDIGGNFMTSTAQGGVSFSF